VNYFCILINFNVFEENWHKRGKQGIKSVKKQEKSPKVYLIPLAIRQRILYNKQKDGSVTTNG